MSKITVLIMYAPLTNHHFAIGVEKALVVQAKAPLFQFLHKCDHEETVCKDDAVFILPDQMAGKFLRTPLGLCPGFGLTPHICEPLNPADY